MAKVVPIDVKCIDCGHVGPAQKKGWSIAGNLMELIVFVVLFLCGIIPGLIYAIYVSRRAQQAKEKRYCQKCRSSAVVVPGTVA